MRASKHVVGSTFESLNADPSRFRACRFRQRRTWNRPLAAISGDWPESHVSSTQAGDPDAMDLQL